jgi:hypothetical protein
MTTPAEYRAFAQRVHDLGHELDTLLRDFKAADVGGSVFVNVEVMALNAGRTALQLEERADHLEVTLQRSESCET